MTSTVVISPRGFETRGACAVPEAGCRPSSAHEGSQPAPAQYEGHGRSAPSSAHEGSQQRPTAHEFVIHEQSSSARDGSQRGRRHPSYAAATGRHQPERVRNLIWWSPRCSPGTAVINPIGFATRSNFGFRAVHLVSLSAREGSQHERLRARVGRDQRRHRPERVHNYTATVSGGRFTVAVISPRGFATEARPRSGRRGSGSSSTRKGSQPVPHLRGSPHDAGRHQREGSQPPYRSRARIRGRRRHQSERVRNVL